MDRLPPELLVHILGLVGDVRLRCVNSTFRQLCPLDRYRVEVGDRDAESKVQTFGTGVHSPTYVFSGVQLPSVLRDVHSLKWVLPRGTVCDSLSVGRVHTLDLSSAFMFPSPRVKDVSALGGVHTLDLSFTRVKDVSALGGVHTLNLSHTLVKDVSALGQVHTLDLSFTQVEDVSALGGVYALDLSGTEVKDVSALGGVHTLNLSHTPADGTRGG